MISGSADPLGHIFVVDEDPVDIFLRFKADMHFIRESLEYQAVGRQDCSAAAPARSARDTSRPVSR